MPSIGSAADPCYLPEYHSNLVITQPDPRGRTISTPRLNAGERTGVFVMLGQSMASNTVDATYSASHASKIDNLNIFDGGAYSAIEPLLGCDMTQGNVWYEIADRLITAGIFDRIILVPGAVTATMISVHAAGGPLNTRSLVAARRLAAVGLGVTAFCWMQGESDTLAGTSQGAYASALDSVIATPRSAGFGAPWLLGRSTWNAGGSSSAVRAAIDAKVDGVDIFAGGDTDGLGAGYRQSGNPHWTATGRAAAAALWTAAIAATLPRP